MKTEAGEVPLIAVGGGAFLVPDKLAGVSEVIRVPHGDCANAVGAAIAQISGETDQIYRDMTRQEAIAAAEAQAVARAVAAGADRASLQTIEIEDIRVAYLPGNASACVFASPETSTLDGFDVAIHGGEVRAYRYDRDVTPPGFAPHRNVAGPLVVAKGLVAGGANLALALAAGARLPAPPTLAGAAVLGFFAYEVSLVLFVFALR